MGDFQFLRLPFGSVEHFLTQFHFLVADAFRLYQSIDQCCLMVQPRWLLFIVRLLAESVHKFSEMPVAF